MFHVHFHLIVHDYWGIYSDPKPQGVAFILFAIITIFPYIPRYSCLTP